MTDEQLTPHFSLSELNPHGDELSPALLDNLKRLAVGLEKVRSILGVPLKITSGYRSQCENVHAGGAHHSYHMQGLAADFEPIGMNLQKAEKMLANWQGGLGEYNGHIHIDLGPTGRRWESPTA